MLNPRLLIVGVFAVVSAWLPGHVTADELRSQLPWPSVPSGYTLDLFEGLTTPARATPRPELQIQETFDLQFPPNRTGGVTWDPVALDDFSAPKKVAARRPSTVDPSDNPVMPCGHACPLCEGTSSPSTAPRVTAPLPDAEAAEYVPEEPAEMRLREDEPAKLLLQTMKKVQPSILDGTIFQDSRPIDDSEAMPLEGEGSAAIIVRCIRSLEAQAERQHMQEANPCLVSSSAPAALTATPEVTPGGVAALRQAGRELETTANMLEERGLYDQADHLRAVAQEMRIEARAANASDQPNVSYVPMPGPGDDSDEIAGDKRLDPRQPKLRYDGDCDDHD